MDTYTIDGYTVQANSYYSAAIKAMTLRNEHLKKEKWHVRIKAQDVNDSQRDESKY